MQAQYPDKGIEIWAEDEARMGLKPLLRRVWAVKGQRPVIAQKRGYIWSHVYAFAQPKTGQSEFWIMPYVNLETMQVCLEAFSKQRNPDKTKLLLLILDNAAWHRSPKLTIPEDIILFPIPPYTPELNPAEPLMPLLHEAIANDCFTTIDEVEDKLSKRCVFLQQHPDTVKAAVGFHWASL